MKIFGINSIVMFVLLVVLVNLGNTPTVESGPLSFATCMLSCCSSACSYATQMCGLVGAATGIFGIVSATGCLLAAGGVCAACVEVCLTTGFVAPV